MKNVLLDTSIVQYYLENNHQVVLNFGMHLARGGKAYISRWSYMQINAWLAGEEDEEARERFFDMLRRMGIVEVSEQTSSRMSSVRNQLARRGRDLDEVSLLNIGVALSEGLAFVTEEDRLNRVVKGLEAKNWL